VVCSVAVLRQPRLQAMPNVCSHPDDLNVEVLRPRAASMSIFSGRFLSTLISDGYYPIREEKRCDV
jgi:hypothetical protein